MYDSIQSPENITLPNKLAGVHLGSKPILLLCGFGFSPIMFEVPLSFVNGNKSKGFANASLSFSETD